MHRLRTVLGLLLLVAGCRTPIRLPVPQRPLLADVHLNGARVCGSRWDNAGLVYDLPCTPLPTGGTTVWRLSPLYRPDQTGIDRPNRILSIRLTTASITTLEIARATPNGLTTMIAQLSAPAARDSDLIGIGSTTPGNALVSASDDGTQKTWNIRLAVSTCPAEVTLHFTSTRNATRSAPLVVKLVRADGERACGGGIGSPGGGAVGIGEAGGPGAGPAAPTAGPCPNGGARTVFKVCESHVHLAPALNRYVEYPACDWNEVLAAFGYKRDATGAMTTAELEGGRLSMTTSAAACRGQ